MAILLYHMLFFLTLFTYGLYHLVSATRHHHLRHPPVPAKPYHPLPLSPHRHHLLRYLPLYLLAFLLLLSVFHSLLTPSPSSIHHLTSLQSSISLLLLLPIPLLPPDLTFLVASLAFALLSSSSLHSSLSFPSSDLQSKSLSLASLISAVSAVSSLSLAINPFLFVSEIALSASVLLQGVWALVTGLLLYVEGFIPEGCHRLLDVPIGIEGSTRCELDESRLRAVAVLDLVFVVCVAVVGVVTVGVYLLVVRTCGGVNVRRAGTYEALPMSSSVTEVADQVQMKAIGKNSMQA